MKEFIKRNLCFCTFMFFFSLGFLAGIIIGVTKYFN